MGNTLFPDWLSWDAVQKVVAALGPDSVRFVGGAVRDSLLGLPVSDLDAATVHLPEEATARLKAAGLSVVPTGLQHGTVTAIYDHIPIEVTTLRIDVKSHGRHADVAFTEDWKADAARRDLTMNALYLSATGDLYDPFGGVEDALAGRVRFIGDAASRIREDALRIIRYFRFYARYGSAPLDTVELDACRDLAPLLDGLSGERIWTELKKMSVAPNAFPALSAMADTGILGQLGLNSDMPRLYPHISGLDDPFDIRALTMFFLMIHGAGSGQSAKARMNMSRAESATLKSLSILSGLWDAPDITQVRNYVYRFGAGPCYEMAQIQKMSDLAEEITRIKLPDFPVQGRDLLARGVAPGPQMGQFLKELEKKWIASDFSLDRDALLASL
ncbi:cytidine(C)-cytidine(C)-adenosine (A)]-adding enzyme [Kordiimonas sediminis]|uniref:Cytidine(C)-cytidine(C)-adenosine (A)]-adding enzyme n=1 Tax=Kordiimonas sediminis TaxID=1735581 RepID=A0A919AU20_9PROT|nr:CCA tRNA nucleotidyltransferase [Kordiimonas sediminis]GHF23782.1 cytidine(C)-cytidine(C)-adenosine (A)]-adding enzyme [Kordiimonas sediminis]